MSEQAYADLIQKYCGPHRYGEQDDNGIDLSLIRENLELTPLERIRRGEIAMRDTLMLLEVGNQHRDKLVRTVR